MDAEICVLAYIVLSISFVSGEPHKHITSAIQYTIKSSVCTK